MAPTIKVIAVPRQALVIVLIMAACQRAAPAPTSSPISPTSSLTSVPAPLSPTPTATPALTPTAEPRTPLSLVLVNGTVIDGTGTEPVHDAILVIRDGRIAAVGLASDVTIPTDAQVIDLQDATILPGFINAHVHQSLSPTNLAAWAQAGVTTVRDLAAPIGLPDLDWDEWVQGITEHRDLPSPMMFVYRDATRGQPHYARLVAAGPIVTVPGGYPIPNWGPEIALTVNSPEDARRKVSALLDAGADVVKIAIQTGTPQLSQEEVAAIAATAHERGTIVTAHVGGAFNLEVAVAGGIDDAAHMAVTPLSDELIAQMIADDVYIVPTLSVLEAYFRLGSSVENLRRFVATGGKVALGDDYGNPGIELGMPVREMELMQEAGMTPMQVIVAATKHGAHVCNLEQELGTLEVGKIADVLVVDGDPLQDIHVMTNVRLVIRDGIIIHRAGS